MNEREKLKYTLDKMSSAAANLLKTDAEKVDVSWIAGFVSAAETTSDAIE